MTTSSSTKWSSWKNAATASAATIASRPAHPRGRQSCGPRRRASPASGREHRHDPDRQQSDDERLPLGREQRDQVERGERQRDHARPGPAARLPAAAMRSDPLADLFLDQAGRTPGHEHDHDREGEHVLVGAGERSATAPMVCSAGEQEAAEDGAIDVPSPPMMAAAKPITPRQRPMPKLISL